MDIELPEFMKTDLWRNKLIGLYQKYWADLQNLPSFKFGTSTFFVKTLEKIVTKIRSGSEVSHIATSPQAKTIRKLERDINLLKKQMSEIEDKFDYLSDPERQSEYSEFKSILQILEILKAEFENLKIKVIHHPNNQLEFLDAENKIILKTQEKEPS